MKIEKTEIFGFRGALRGMRNAMSSWDKSDSEFYAAISNEWIIPAGVPEGMDITAPEQPIIGPNDLKLARVLSKQADSHSKYLRQINISVDITIPRYIWQELDTYKVGTVRNSCSTRPSELKKMAFTLDMFETAGLETDDLIVLQAILSRLNIRQMEYWEAIGTSNPKEATRIARIMKKLLPEALLQKATYTLNYQVAQHIYFDRKDHWLSEWQTICGWIASLPYAKDLITAKE